MTAHTKDTCYFLIYYTLDDHGVSKTMQTNSASRAATGDATPRRGISAMANAARRSCALRSENTNA